MDLDPYDPADWDVEEAWDLTAADEVDGAAQMVGHYPDQTAPDAASAGDRDPGVEVDPEVARDAGNRARLAAILVVADRREAEVAALAAAHAATWADLAAGWACPHPSAQDLTDAEVSKEWRAASREPITRGVQRGLSIAGIHDGYHGICQESIEGCAQLLAAHYPSWTIGYAREKVTRSIRLSRGLPHTLTAWATAALDQRQVDVIVRGTDLITDPHDSDTHDSDSDENGEDGEGGEAEGRRGLLAQVDARLCGPGDDALAHTRTLSTGALRARVHQVVAEVDAAATAQRSRRAAARRSVRRYDEADGHATLQLTGPAPAVAEMQAAIHAAGQASKTDATHRNREHLPSLDPWALPADGEADRRGIDAHRFDAAHTLITAATAHLTGLRLTTDGHGHADTGVTDGFAPPGDHEGGDAAASRADDTAGDTASEAGDSDTAAGHGLVVIATRNLAARWAALTGMPRPHLPHVLVGLSTLAGADTHPAQLDGYGPLPGWMSEAMLRHRGLRRMILDPLTGTLRHLDGHVYPPGHLDHLTPPPDDSDGAEGGGEGGDGDGPGPRPDGGGGSPGGRGPRGPRGGGPAHEHDDPDATTAREDATTDPGLDTAAASADGETCSPVDPDACPVRRNGLATVAAGLPGRPSGTYEPSPALAAFVRRHWATCTATGCRRRAATCDLDHTIPWPTGATCSCDLAPLCRTHHKLKHGTPHYGSGPPAAWAARAGTLPWKWTLHRCTDGHQHWTDPLGATHVVTAPPPLGVPRPDQPETAELATALPALDYPARTCQVRPVRRPDSATSTALRDPATPRHGALTDDTPPF